LCNKATLKGLIKIQVQEYELLISINLSSHVFPFGTSLIHVELLSVLSCHVKGIRLEQYTLLV